MVTTFSLGALFCLMASVQAASVGQLTQQDIDDIVSTHNNVRQLIKDGKFDSQPQGAVEPLKWDKELAQQAYNFISTTIARSGACPRGHSEGRQGVGENIAWGAKNFKERVQSWIDEYKIYRFSPINKHTYTSIGHYTQVVWADTEYVGCAFGEGCSSGIILVCNYSPGGNFIGQYPYKAGTGSSQDSPGTRQPGPNPNYNDQSGTANQNTRRRPAQWDGFQQQKNTGRRPGQWDGFQQQKQQGHGGWNQNHVQLGPWQHNKGHGRWNQNQMGHGQLQWGRPWQGRPQYQWGI